MKNLEETVIGMTSSNYKDRFKAEYQQTETRYLKLKNFCNRIELAELYGIGIAPKHDCPLSLLREQQRYMGEYLGCLEKRALIEDIEL